MSTWRYLLGLARYQPRFFLMLATRTFSIALIPQGIALTTRAVFDNITNEQAATVGFWSLAALLVAFSVGRSLIIFGNVVLSVRVDFTFATLLRKNVFDHVLDQPGNRALPESTGEAVTRFREDVEYITKYIQRFSFAIPLVAFAAVALYIMVQISPLITFAVFLPLALIMMTVSAATRWLRRFRIDNRESTGDVTSLLGEMFGSVETIKVANAESRMLGELKRLNNRRKTYTIRDTLLTQALNSVFQNTVTIGTGLILLHRGVGDAERLVYDRRLRAVRELPVHGGVAEHGGRRGAGGVPADGRLVRPASEAHARRSAGRSRAA